MEHRLKGPPPSSGLCSHTGLPSRAWPLSVIFLGPPEAARGRGERATSHGECACKEQMFVRVLNLKGRSNQFRSRG